MRDADRLIKTLKPPPPSLRELVVAEWLGVEVRQLRERYPAACKESRERETAHDD